MVRRTDNYGIKATGPTFFKAIIPGYNTEKLRIPPHILKHNRSGQPERAILKWNLSLEYSWSVKVIRTKEDVYFKDGWREFLNDNSVKEDDLLVFTYDGNMHFSIRYFDNTSCWRGVIPTNKAQEESAPAKSTNRNPGGRPRKDYSAAISFKSKFPHYTKDIKKTSCVYSILTTFYREHISAGNYEFASLKISGGNKWYKVKLVPSYQTAFISKGWAAFARDNQIKFGNVCTFELVKENQMVVHILRK